MMMTMMKARFIELCNRNWALNDRLDAQTNEQTYVCTYAEHVTVSPHVAYCANVLSTTTEITD